VVPSRTGIFNAATGAALGVWLAGGDHDGAVNTLLLHDTPRGRCLVMGCDEGARVLTLVDGVMTSCAQVKRGAHRGRVVGLHVGLTPEGEDLLLTADSLGRVCAWGLGPAGARTQLRPASKRE
jgi:hypothetical protein